MARTYLYIKSLPLQNKNVCFLKQQSKGRQPLFLYWLYVPSAHVSAHAPVRRLSALMSC
ncbi:MAG: hypothetical protein RLZZ502_1596 [Pseudomonadota bacterium]|jgi:hypothetical protein